MASVNDHETRIVNLEQYYKKDITITGDANTYYPVCINLSRKDNGYDNYLCINRQLGETCNPTYDGNHSNKTSSMVLSFELRLAGWDGNASRCCVTNIIQPYANLISDIYINNGAYSGIVVWLRGGTTLYHIKSTCNFTVNVYYEQTNIGSSSSVVNVAPKTTVKSLYDLIYSGTSSKSFGINSLITGNIKAFSDITASKVYNAVWNDYAEFYPRGEKTESGDIIQLDTLSKEEKYIKAKKGSTTVVGVHSDTFGHLIGGENPEDGKDYVEHNLDKYIPVGLVGRVNCKILGKIKKGDRVVVSDINGVGRKFNPSTDTPFQIFGMAVEDKDTDTIEKVKINFRGGDSKAHQKRGDRTWLV